MVMKANPGGTLPPDQTVGRDDLCRECWRSLETQSIRLENERRLGKTTVIRKMIAEAPAGTRTVVMEVGGLSSTVDFIEELIREIDRTIPEKGNDYRTRLRKLMGLAGGAEIAGVLRIPEAAHRNWREILFGCVGELLQVTPERVVFFWDELPWMLQKIQRRSGDDMAVIDLLDTLRDIRQRHDRIRMVYTGSIGFHHVIAGLEEAGIPSRPVNDMRRIDVPPLEREHAIELAARLLIGEGLEVEDLDATAQALHKETGGIAFYIHNVVADLRPGRRASPDLVRRAVSETLRGPEDRWEMRHFDTRLRSYYGDEEEVARRLLDTVAAADGPMPLEELRDRLRGGGFEKDPRGLRALLRKLALDHYLTEPPDRRGHYVFKFDILRRWWRIDRDMDD